MSPLFILLAVVCAATVVITFAVWVNHPTPPSFATWLLGCGLFGTYAFGFMAVGAWLQSVLT